MGCSQSAVKHFAATDDGVYAPANSNRVAGSYRENTLADFIGGDSTTNKANCVIPESLFTFKDIGEPVSLKSATSNHRRDHSEPPIFEFLPEEYSGIAETCSSPISNIFNSADSVSKELPGENVILKQGTSKFTDTIAKYPGVSTNRFRKEESFANLAQYQQKAYRFRVLASKSRHHPRDILERVRQSQAVDKQKTYVTVQCESSSRKIGGLSAEAKHHHLAIRRLVRPTSVFKRKDLANSNSQQSSPTDALTSPIDSHKTSKKPPALSRFSSMVFERTRVADSTNMQTLAGSKIMSQVARST